MKKPTSLGVLQRGVMSKILVLLGVFMTKYLLGCTQRSKVQKGSQFNFCQSLEFRLQGLAN